MDIKKLLGDNYKEDMTADELINALSDVEIDDNSKELTKLKEAVSKANSEASNYKKQLNAKLSEEELKEKEAKEQVEELQAKYDELLKESTMSKLNSKFLGLGYDEDSAIKASKAIFENDTDEFFAIHSDFLKSYEKKLTTEFYKNSPKPEGGSESKKTTKEDLHNMSISERLKFANENPDEYREIYEE